MSQSCDSPCTEKTTFPERPFNRPALSKIDYRIGKYHDIRKALLRALNLDPTLQSWTHREPNDPGIALLEGASILGDILVFYQEHYANECFLRTANWRESIASLVSLLGYRLSPAVGGKANFAFELKEGNPVTIPSGFPVKADLENLESAAEFETLSDLTAYPHLSSFSLYRPRSRPNSILKGNTSFEIFAAGTTAVRDPDSLDALPIKPGANLILVPGSTGSKPEIVTVKEVETVVDRLIVHLETPVQRNWPSTTKVYVLGRSFRHHGHNAPNKLYENIKGSDGTITGTKQSDTAFERYLNKDGQYITQDTSFYPSLDAHVWALDQEVKDIDSGSTVICTGRGSVEILNGDFTTVRTVTSVYQNTLQWGNFTGPSTQLSLDDDIYDPSSNSDHYFADVRRLELHEVASDPFWIRPLAQGNSGAFGSGPFLFFHGTQVEAKALAGRKLLFTDEAGRSDVVRCENTESQFTLQNYRDSEHTWLWKLMLSAAPSGFSLDDFDEEEPTITVFGNVVEADQGRTQSLAEVGSGDQRKAFQTFALPKEDLTHHLNAGATPAEVPELEVYVDGQKWDKVDTFYGQTAASRVFILRQDEEGKFYIQFGDGKTGARLPTGKKNVKVLYRIGTGAYGPIKEGAKAQAIDRIDGLSAIQMPMEATGGSSVEDGENAREAAPGKIQSLGRLVSLQDYESEALAIPGVVRASARWDSLDDTTSSDFFASPSILVTLLMESDRLSEFDEVSATLQSYEQCRGPSRQTILTRLGRRRYLALEVQFGLDPAYLEEDVKKSIRTALGVHEGDSEASSGLFALNARRLGQPVYLTQAEGCIQQVAGVTWVRLVGWVRMPLSTTSSSFMPTWLYRFRKLYCSASEILQLHAEHLVLHTAPSETKTC